MPQPEKSFRKGTVQLGLRSDSLLVLATLDDDDLFTAATGDHQRMWELGDVLEIFLCDSSREDYIEMHVTPNGRRTQLRFPNAAATPQIRRDGRDPIATFGVFEPIFDFTLRATSAGWQVFASIPFTSITPGGVPEIILASFSRFDASPANPSRVLSSTSPHPGEDLDFHRRQDWTPLKIAAASPGNS